MNLTKTQSYINMLKDIETSLEKDITDYLNDMTVDDLDKVIKNAGHVVFRSAGSDSLKLNGIGKSDNLFWLYFTDDVLKWDDWNYTIDQLNLQDKLQLLKLIEETI